MASDDKLRNMSWKVFGGNPCVAWHVSQNFQDQEKMEEAETVHRQALQAGESQGKADPVFGWVRLLCLKRHCSMGNMPRRLITWQVVTNLFYFYYLTGERKAALQHASLDAVVLQSFGTRFAIEREDSRGTGEAAGNSWRFDLMRCLHLFSSFEKNWIKPVWWLCNWILWIHFCVDESRYCQTGKFSQAEDLCRRALAGSEMELGQTETLHYINRHRQRSFAVADQQTSFFLISMFDTWHHLSCGSAWKKFPHLDVDSWIFLPKLILPCWNGTEEHSEPCIETILWTKKKQERHVMSSHWQVGKGAPSSRKDDGSRRTPRENEPWQLTNSTATESVWEIFGW